GAGPHERGTMLDLPPGGEGSLGSPRVSFGDELRARTGGVRVIRAFIFDLDGTLVETEELKGLSYARAATELRRPDLSEEEVLEAFKDLVGLSRQEVAVGLMRRFALEEAARDRMAEFGVGTPWQAFVRIRLGIYEELLADPELVLEHRYPHNIALLRDVRSEGYPTALATQSHREQALRVLEILGLTDEFDVIVTREDVEHGKPDPEMHLLAARELGVRPGECLAIEDSPAGVQGALAAGTETIAVTTNLTRQKFRDTDILDRSHVVDDPRTLPEVVRHLIDASRNLPE
ncbi:MAG: HAD family phosphatase, partial [Actinomycetota bacterium]|nr:HAD family phosphatase [Actinomycetota bacterium]